MPRPATQWEGRTVAAWATALAIPELLVYDSVTSTNDAARARAEAGAPAGLVVIADHQSAGRGRMGRRWQDRPRSAVLLSFLMRPAAASAPATAPLRIGMAAAGALRAATGVDVRLKWPNDLVVPGAGKVGGILCEAINAGARNGCIVAGMGINVHDHPADTGDRYPAASLDSCTGSRNERGAIAHALITALLPLRDIAIGQLSTDELRSFAMLDTLQDEIVTIDSEPDAYCARGVDATGALLVERDGVLRRLNTATVRTTRTVECP